MSSFDERNEVVLLVSVIFMEGFDIYYLNLFI